MNYPYKTYQAELPGNCHISYMDEGKGEQTILFIHGLAGYGPVWKKNLDALKDRYRCIVIDLPGNGLSDRNDHPFGIRFFADAVYSLVHSLSLSKVVLAGHSMGGQVALTTLIHYPDVAEKLVLCAPAGFETFTTLDKTMYYSTLHLLDHLTSEEKNLRQTLERSFYHLNTAHAESMINELASLMKTYKLDYYRKMIEACIRGMLEEPVFDRMKEIRQPTLVMFGEKDALIPNKILHHTTTEKVAEDGAKKLQNAVLKMISGAGHFVQWEKADNVNEHISAFLG